MQVISVEFYIPKLSTNFLGTARQGNGNAIFEHNEKNEGNVWYIFYRWINYWNLKLKFENMKYIKSHNSPLFGSVNMVLALENFLLKHTNRHIIRCCKYEICNLNNLLVVFFGIRYCYHLLEM